MADSHKYRRKKPAKARRVSEAATLKYGSEGTRKKNLRLHQSKIDDAMKILGTETETETIEAALDLVVFRQELLEGVHAMRGAQLADPGATSPALQRRTHESFIAPFENRNRIITPSHEAWKRAAGAIAQLIARKRVSPNGITRSLVNGCVIAASVRENGCILITENRKDFAAIGAVLPIDVVQPWPDE